MAVLPSQILLPPSREVARSSHHGPVQIPSGSLVLGRVLPSAGGPETTPDGRPGVRVEFPQGIVVVPTDDPPETGTRFFAQVREEQGRTLLRLLDGVERGTLLQGNAHTATPAGGQTAIAVAGVPSPVDAAGPVERGDVVLAQVQPRGSRAALQALPASLTQASPRIGTVVSAEGPLLAVEIDGVRLLARPLGALRVGEQVTVRVAATARGLELIAQAAGSRAEAAGHVVSAANTGAAAATPHIDALLQALGAQSNPANRAAVAALIQAGFTQAEIPPIAVGATLSRDAPVPPLLTSSALAAGAALQRAGVDVTALTVQAAVALIDAEVAVTPQAIHAARTFLAEGVPVTPRTIAAAVALIEIAVPPQARAVEALAGALFAPSTLSADVAQAQQAAQDLSRLPDLPPRMQPALQEIVGGLTRLLLDTTAEGASGTRVADAAQFGGLQTEATLARLLEHAGTSDAATARTATAGPAVESSLHAARDLRVLLGRLQEIARDAAATVPAARDVHATLEQVVPRLVDRIQGLQLQNLRAPVLEHLTLELPVAADGSTQSVQLRVYYRQDPEQGRRIIDERNTTLALLLDTTRLGPVNATLTIADGHMHVDFKVDTRDVANHLLAGADELRNGLQDLDYSVGRIGATARRQPASTHRATERPARIGPEGLDVQV